MKRKICVVVSMFLCFTLVLSLAACGSSASSDPYELYINAAKKLDKPDAVSMNMNMKTAATIGEESYDSTIDGTIAMIYSDDRKSVDMSMDLKTSTDGEETTMLAYYKDGYLYSELMGMKLKMETPMDEAVGSFSGSQVQIFSADAVIDKKLEKVKGGTKVTIKVKGDALKELAADSLSDLGDTDTEITYQDATISAVIDKKGNLIAYDVDMSFDVVAEDNSGSFKVKASLSDIVIDNVKIDFPDDLDEYQDFSDFAGAGGDE
jgi:hypothetical protein